MGVFNDVNDAMGQVGGLLNSPAMTSVDAMRNASTNLDVTTNLDRYTLEQGFPGHGDEFFDQMSEIQKLSDSLDECGNYAQDIIKASTEDYIKNTGIQQAGRDLANMLGQYSDEVDCLAGFATLFDSKGILDDVLGLGDLPQIQSRVQQILKDVTNPDKLSNMITNLDAVQGLLVPWTDFCVGMKEAFDLLVAKDLATLNAILNKLAQWAAFTNLATGDPCALVNNNKMFGAFTDPVMDDIIDLYNGVLGGNIGDTIADIFAPDDPSALGGVSSLVHTAGGTTPFGTYFAGLGTDVGGIQTSIGNIVKSSDEQLSEFLGTDSITTVPLVWNGSEWAEEQDLGVISGISSITAGIGEGTNTFNPALANFKDMKNKVEFAALNKSKEAISYTVDSCRGAPTANSQSDCIEQGGLWSTTNFSPTDSAMANSVRNGMPSIDDITSGVSNLFNSKTEIIDLNTITNSIEDDLAVEALPGGNVDLNSVENGIDNDLATEEPPGGASGSDSPANSLPSGAKETKPHSVSRSINRSAGIAAVPSKASKRPPSSSSRPSDGRTPFNVPSPLKVAATGAQVQSPSNSTAFENSISAFDSGINALKRAQQTGDFSNVESCKCLGGVGRSSDARSCVNNGGNWTCQGGTAGATTSKSIKSLGTIASARNIELSSILPTSKAFGGIT